MLRKANEETVARGRVPKDMIVFANPDKPFPRSGKGSVQRGLPPDLYSDEINETYERKSLLEDGALEGLSSQDVEILTKIFRHWIGSQTGRQVPDMSDDLFDAGLGLDSLLKGGMNAMLNQYSQDLRVPTVPSTAPPKQDLIVVVTGTTGTFGSYLLSSLLHSLSISKIYCLNCNENAAASLRAFVQRSPSSNSSFSSLEGKLTYITIDLSKPNLSLPNCSYEALVEDIDVIIHSAWLVDFNLPLSSSARTISMELSTFKHLRSFQNIKAQDLYS
ncbi:MAG: hypothetical protein Q9157_004025 [Trypethelium eluteriae]